MELFSMSISAYTSHPYTIHTCNCRETEGERREKERILVSQILDLLKSGKIWLYLEKFR